MKSQQRLLDLFSATGSVAAVFRQHGYAVTTVDVDAKMKPDIVANVLNWNYRGMPQGQFDVVFAASPCTEYSQAMTGRLRNLEKADAIVLRTLEIIQYLKPKQWFLENPDTGLLKTRGILDHLPSVRVDYCQFSPWGWMKPTRVW